MKPCPICLTHNCDHEKKFWSFSLAKVILIQRSLDATLNLFNNLVIFLPTTREISYRLVLVAEDLKKCQERMADVKQVVDKQIA